MAYQIVACDDEPYITRSISLKLQRAGYDVRTAPDGRQAYELIQESIPDLLISDCQMPFMNGIELCQQLRKDESTKQLPIILLTAKGFELQQEQLQEQLAIEHVVRKPFSPRALVELVKSMMATHVELS